MAWTIVGVSTNVEVAATSHTLTVPAGVVAGDLLVACISSRIASITSITLPTGGEWTLVGEQKANNILSTSSALPSAMMAYCVRGASNPNLTFTHPTAPSVALGRIVAYRGGATPTANAKDTQTSFTTTTNVTAVSGTGLTTTLANDLIVAMVAGGQEAAWSSFNATTPSGASGATDTTTAPSATWQERAEQVTTTGVDTSLGIFDALKTAAGATGNLTVTASVAAGHSLIAGAFKPSVSVVVAVTGQALAVSMGPPSQPISFASSGNPAGAAFVSGTTVTREFMGSAGYVAEVLPPVPVVTVEIVAGGGVSVAVAGVEAIGAVGTVAAVINAPIAVTGFQAIGGVGGVTVVGKASISMTGLDAAASVGSVTVSTASRVDVSVPITGVSATGSVGSVTVTGKANAAIIGVQATGSVDAATAVGRTSVNVPVTGVEATGASGSITVVGKANVPVTGVAAAGSVESVSVVGKANVPLTGVAAVGTVGGVSVVAGGSISITLTGVEAIGSVGSVTVTAAELAGLVSVWNGSAWVDKPAKVWSGSTWQQKPVKHWTGSAWV